MTPLLARSLPILDGQQGQTPAAWKDSGSVQNDVDRVGFPARALGSWATFKETSDSAPMLIEGET